MTLIRSVAVWPTVREESGYPFDLPLIRALPVLDVSAPVTFLVGENGSGKSTIPRSPPRSGRSRSAGRRPRRTRRWLRPGGWRTV